jgi:tetratricopeptide (TPR) repeat protein
MPIPPTRSATPPPRRKSLLLINYMTQRSVEDRRDANLGIDFDGNAFAFFGFTIAATFRNGPILQLPFMPHVVAPSPTGVGSLALAIFRLSADAIIFASLNRLVDIAKRVAAGLDLQPQIERLQTGDVQKCQVAIERLTDFVLQERRHARETLQDVLNDGSGRSIISPDLNFDPNVRFMAAEAFLRIGETRKDTSTLALASNAFRTIANEDWKHNQSSLDWARVHEKLGDCYTSYGRLETHLQRLRNALPAYRTAARAYLILEMPDARARVLVKLGEVLQILGQRENSFERFNGAVVVFRDALRAYDPGATPDSWRRVQASLGKTLKTMSERPRSKARQLLAQAAEAFERALEPDKNNVKSLERLEIQLLLAKTLRKLGELSSGGAGLSQFKKCADTYGLLSRFYPQRNDPDEWVNIQRSFAEVLQVLAERGDQPATRLEQAIHSYRAALEKLTRERSPSDWAATIRDLGVAQMKLGGLRANVDDLKSALSSFHSALTVYASDTKAAEWVSTQTFRGNTLVMIAERQMEAGQPIDAVETFKAAQAVFEQLMLTDELESTLLKLNDAEALVRKSRELASRRLLVRLWGNFLARTQKPTDGKGVTEESRSRLHAERSDSPTA